MDGGQCWPVYQKELSMLLSNLLTRSTPPLLALILCMLPACRHAPKDPRTGNHFNPYAKGVFYSDDQIREATLQQIESHRLPEDWEFRLGPGDVLRMELLGEPELPTITPVSPDGMIYFSLLPGLHVAGLTVPETKDLIEDQLKEYVNTPEVSIQLQDVQSHRVWVLGRLTTPGVYTITTPMTVIEAITRAGGLDTAHFTGTTEELADLHHSFLIRDQEVIPIDFNALIREGDTGYNLRLRNGDYIYLPSALSQEVYVMGEVMQPRAIGFKNQVTLLGAIAQAEGPTRDAHIRQITIIRGSLSDPKTALIDYDAILKGKQPDVLLQPRDIIYVPSRPHQKLIDLYNVAVSTFARTIAVNEGARLGNREALPANVTIGVGQ